MKNIDPVFIVSSGRSGTFALVDVLKQNDDIQVYHEFLFELILKNAVLYKMELVDSDTIKSLLQETYSASMFYSRKKKWVDCSNALPWIISPLAEMFPAAKFIHLIRDGRKVVSSFYNKFSSVMYEDGCVSDMLDWLDNKGDYPSPPAEKRYWRPIPVYNKEIYEKFLKYDQFQRLCYYWSELNEHTETALEKISEAQRITVKFEDLLIVGNEQKRFCEFMDIEYNKDTFAGFSRPVNVHEPKNYILSKDQLNKFREICWPTMEKYGYAEKEEYNVKY